MSLKGDHSVTPEPSSRSTRMTRSRGTPKGKKQSLKEKSPPLRGEKRPAEDDSTMPPRSLRQRKSIKVTMDLDNVVEQAIQPMAEEERQFWKGWVELESEPVSPSCSRMIPCKVKLTLHLRPCLATLFGNMVSRTSRLVRFTAWSLRGWLISRRYLYPMIFQLLLTISEASQSTD